MTAEMRRRLAGKGAPATGVSRSIGAAIALRLADGGAAVTITCSASPERAAAVVAGIERSGARALSGAVACLASPEAAFVTGADLVADGGFTA